MMRTTLRAPLAVREPLTKRLLHPLVIAAALAATPALAGGPTSPNYAIPTSAFNAGVDTMSSSNYKVSSSLGDAVFGGTSTSVSFRLTSGLWPQAYGVGPVCILDLDGNGRIDALSDGLMLVRTMLGLSGTAVTAGAIGSGATRTTWSQIQPYMNSAAYNVDGNAAPDAATDGIMLIRAMFGMKGVNVTTGALGIGATRNTWTAIRNHVNATCGTSFAL